MSQGQKASLTQQAVLVYQGLTVKLYIPLLPPIISLFPLTRDAGSWTRPAWPEQAPTPDSQPRAPGGLWRSGSDCETVPCSTSPVYLSSLTSPTYIQYNRTLTRGVAVWTQTAWPADGPGPDSQPRAPGGLCHSGCCCGAWPCPYQIQTLPFPVHAPPPPSLHTNSPDM